MHQQHARILSQPGTALQVSLRSLAERLETEHSVAEDGLRIRLSGGTIHLDGDSLSLASSDARGLFSLQQLVIRQARQTEVAADLQWDHIDVGALPPNFSPATVLDQRRVTPNFTRLRLGLDDIERFGPDSLHFRLVISARPAGTLTSGSIPRLPQISPQGSVEWPEGDEALHRPVYTVTEVNQAEGWLDFDIFRHEGGRVTAWADVARPGDRIGIMGPTLLRRDLGPWVGFYGDETAVPAIRLYLAALASETEGEVVITLGDMADAQDLPRPEGVKLRHLPRRDGALLDAVKAAPLRADHGYLYAGCERAEADALRSHARDGLGLHKTRMNITSFWSAP